MKKKQSKGMGELLTLLRTHPELVHALVFDSTKVKRLLKSKTARGLVSRVDTRAFLGRVAGPESGGPIALCVHGTAHLCPKGTRSPRGTPSPKGRMRPFDCPRGTLL